MISKLKSKITSTALLLASQIATVSAQGPGGVRPIVTTGSIDIPGIVNSIMNWGFGLLVVLAALFMLWAAYMYLTAGAVPDNLEKAKHYILYAVIAIVVGFIAKGIVTVITGLLGAQ